MAEKRKQTKKDKKIEKKREKISEKAAERKAPKNSNNAATKKTGSKNSSAKKSPEKKAQEKKSPEKKTKAKTQKKRKEAAIPASAVLPINRQRIAMGFAFVLLLLFALMIRMGYWQIVRADELRNMATEMQKEDTEIAPSRGVIYDSRMNTLAESVTEYELYAYSQSLYKAEDVSAAIKKSNVVILSEITEKSPEEIEKILTGEENLVMVGDALTKEQVDKARDAFDSNVVVKTKTSRRYPNGPFVAQVLGGVDANNAGRSGLEYQYNSELAGIKGRTIMTTDRNGDRVSNSSRYYKAENGHSLVTTIDSAIQNFVEEALVTGMKETGADAITCIVMDPKTGDILAMATNPEFDPNKSNRPYGDSEQADFDNMSDEEQADYLSRMWSIRAVTDVYEPGSTFKLITAAAAIDSANADDSSVYICNGYIPVGGYNLHCLSVHGPQDLKHAVGHSCNPALAQVAMDTGGETLYNYIDIFGFDDKTGVDLPGETNSIVKDPETMSLVDLATTGYGQGIAVTPLQLLCAINIFGNDGILMKPKIVKKIIDENGNTVKEFEDVKVRKVVSEPTVEKMKDIMEFYVSSPDAGGTTAYVPGYRVGGKTGTANFVEDAKYSSATNTSFVAMAPMDDPKISMICIVYRPTKKQYGAFTAGPIVQEITEKTLQYMGVERVYSKGEEKENKKDYVKVPDVTGEDSNTAMRILRYEGLDYIVMPESDKDKSFVVVDQYPKAGTKVEEDSVVYIYSE